MNVSCEWFLLNYTAAASYYRLLMHVTLNYTNPADTESHG